MFTRAICLFLHTWTLQATWSIYYFHRSNSGAANLSLHSYHPTNRNGSKEIASFEYPIGMDYQVAPIWDCKVALVPENSNTQKVVTFDMLNNNQVKPEHTLLNKRSGFATMMLKRSKLYVCGGLLEGMTGMCEVWTKSDNKFVGIEHWNSFARTSFTMLEMGSLVCLFGGYNGMKTSRSNIVTCFNDQGTVTNLELNCVTDHIPYREKRASIRYDNITVIFCGGDVHALTYKCDVLRMGTTGGHVMGTCLNPIEVNNWYNYISPRLLKWGEDILLFGELAHKTANVESQVRVVKLFAGYLGRSEDQLPLLHNDYSNTKLFNVPASCTPLEHTTSPVQKTVTSSCLKASMSDRSPVSIEPYQIALGCLMGLCLILFGLLVFVAAKWTSHAKLGEQNKKTVKTPKHGTESSVMLQQNNGSPTNLDSKRLTPASSRTPLASEKNHLVRINLKSEQGKAGVIAQSANFPQISESTATCLNSEIGINDVCSHTNSRTPIASSRHSTA